MKNNIRKIKGIASAFLLPLILMLMLSSSTNFHYHKMSDGQIICHSHPYESDNSENPFESHNHSSSSYIIIHQVNETISEVVCDHFQITIIDEIKTPEYSFDQDIVLDNVHNHISLRGPPSPY